MKLLVFVLSATSFLSSALFAVTLTVQPVKDNIQFTAIGKPGFLKIVGKEASLHGQAQVDAGKVTGTFDVILNDFKTGIEMRDEHMKTKYLQTQTYPKAVLDIKDLAVPSNGSGDVNFKGDLSLHGVKKAIDGKSSVTWKNSNEATVKGDFEIVLSDYNIQIPSYLGIKVADKVHVEFDFVAKK